MRPQTNADNANPNEKYRCAPANNVEVRTTAQKDLCLTEMAFSMVVWTTPRMRNSCSIAVIKYVGTAQSYKLQSSKGWPAKILMRVFISRSADIRKKETSKDSATDLFQ